MSARIFLAIGLVVAILFISQLHAVEWIEPVKEVNDEPPKLLNAIRSFGKKV